MSTPQYSNEKLKKFFDTIDLHKKISKMSDIEIYEFVEQKIWANLSFNSEEDFYLSQMMTRFPRYAKIKFDEEGNIIKNNPL